MAAGCEEREIAEKQEEMKNLVSQVATVAAQLTAGAEIKNPTASLPTEKPPEKPKMVIVSREARLVDIVEEAKKQFSLLEGSDPYYPWYCLNGGQKFFNPELVPAGTEIFIPEKGFLLPSLPEVKTPPEKWEHQLATHTTSLEGSSPERNKNIKVATKKLNGVVVPPYKLFSTLSVLEPYTKEEGYVMGWGYTQKGEVPMFAGGICQLPSTLFKPSLAAGMLVVERRAHAYYSPRYGPWDATINEGGENLGEPIDFTFRNLYDSPVQVRAEVGKDEKSLKIEIWSPQASPYQKVDLEVLYHTVKSEAEGGMAAVKQKVSLAGRARERIYYSQYQPKPR